MPCKFPTKSGQTANSVRKECNEKKKTDKFSLDPIQKEARHFKRICYLHVSRWLYTQSHRYFRFAKNVLLQKPWLQFSNCLHFSSDAFDAPFFFDFIAIILLKDDSFLNKKKRDDSKCISFNACIFGSQVSKSPNFDKSALLSFGPHWLLVVFLSLSLDCHTWIRCQRAKKSCGWLRNERKKFHVEILKCS